MSGVKITGFECFKELYGGIEDIQPINIIIGRNNSGKSSLLKLLKQLTESLPCKLSFDTILTGNLNEDELRKYFKHRVSSLTGDPWEHHGSDFLGQPVRWHCKQRKMVGYEFLDQDFNPDGRYRPQTNPNIGARRRVLNALFTEKGVPFYKFNYQQLSSERDIRREQSSDTLMLDMNGAGATNIIRKYINQSGYPRELIQEKLLEALNSITGNDIKITEITIQDYPGGDWEVYLGETEKGIIPLSRSGSGLKTILLVLLRLIVIPHIEKWGNANQVLAFEELENNLHPSILRRLLSYIEQHVVSNNHICFLTTHSSVTLDHFARCPGSSVTHVLHNGEYAETKSVDIHFDRLLIIKDIGAKASDILQANGIIWVEGPSDRIYVNRWIELYSDSKLHEGRDYVCAFYGGALLANYQYAPPEDAFEDLSNLIQINPNVVFIADGDRSASAGHGSRPKKRVSRVAKQVRNSRSGLAWITDEREIESYIPTRILEKLWSRTSLPCIGKYEVFSRTPTKTNKTKGYHQKHSGKGTLDKVKLAAQVIPHLSISDIKAKPELESSIRDICGVVIAWNE